jgi:hypothetical protein
MSILCLYELLVYISLTWCCQWITLFFLRFCILTYYKNWKSRPIILNGNKSAHLIFLGPWQIVTKDAPLVHYLTDIISAKLGWIMLSCSQKDDDEHAFPIEILCNLWPPMATILNCHHMTLEFRIGQSLKNLLPRIAERIGMKLGTYVPIWC